MPRTLLRSFSRLVLAGLATLAGSLPAQKAEAFSPYLVVPAPSVAEASSAYRYANMTAAEAIAELDKRKVPYRSADPISGVLAPVRLTGKLHGVWIHSSIPESQRATSVYEVLDARLALALDDLAKILERHDIEEVVHYSLYRPNVPREDHDIKEESQAKAASKPAAAPAANAMKTPAPAAITVKPAAPAAAAIKAPAAPAIKASAIPAKLPAAAPAKNAPKESAIKAAPAAVAKLPVASLPDAGRSLPAQPVKGAARSGLKQKASAAIGKPAVAPTGHAAKPRVASTAQKAPVAGRLRMSNDMKAPAKMEAKPAVSAAPAAPVSRQTWAAPGTRHPAGLAIDVALLKKRDGQWISVARHFQGKIGAKTCGDGVRTADTPEARELRSIVCECSDLGVFTYVLTPNFNAAHFDHFHMEVRPTVKWFLYQ